MPVVLPDPIPDKATREFWTQARDGRFVLPWCLTCGRPHYYPRAACPYCADGELEWRPTSGRARLYSWSVVRVNDLPAFRDLVPYVAAVVALDEGVRAMTLLVGQDGSALDADATPLSADQALAVQFVPSVSGEWRLPVFAPA
jgi:uncharacterized protein